MKWPIPSKQNFELGVTDCIPLPLQAFLIAFTSEFLPRLLYQYNYNWSLKGYANFSLAYSPNGTMSEECR